MGTSEYKTHCEAEKFMVLPVSQKVQKQLSGKINQVFCLREFYGWADIFLREKKFKIHLCWILKAVWFEILQCVA